MILSGFLAGRADECDKEWREELLDKWANEESDLADAVFDATWRGSSSTRGAKRIILLVETKKLDAKTLRLLLIGEWTDCLPSNLIKKIVKYLIETNDPFGIEGALSIMHGWIKNNPEKLSQITHIGWQLIECPTAISEGRMLSYHWGEISKYFVEENPVRIARAILRTYMTGEHHIMKDDSAMQILKKATGKNPEGIWNEVSKILLKKRNMGTFRLLMGLRGWYGNYFNTNFLIEWAKEHPEKGPLILAEIASVGGAKLDELPRLLLINFPGNKSVESRLRGNFLTGTFWGSEVSWFEGKLDNAKSWMKDSNQAIRRWAKELSDIIEENIKRAKLREEEEEF